MQYMLMKSINKQMRVFISSTFKDLNAERDYLMRYVFPELKIIARNRGVDFIALDLRWGITSEDTKNGRVLEICLREIDYSHPYFIGIVGDRYGWCPNEADYNGNHNLCQTFKKIRKYITRQLSITEIEFMYAALDVDEKINAAFFLKEYDLKKVLDSSENGRKLSNFRCAVENNKRYPVSKFHSKEQLGKMIRDYILDELDKLYPEHVVADEYEEQKVIQQWYLESLNENYIPNLSQIRELNKVFLDKSSNRASWDLSISGSSGSGRSSLLAYWMNELKRINDVNVICLFVTHGAEKQGSYDIATYIINQIKELYDVSEDDFVCEGEAYTNAVQVVEELRLEYPQEWLNIFYKIMMLGFLIKGRKPLIVAIDGMTYLPAGEWVLLLGMKCFTEGYFSYIVTTDDCDATTFSNNVVKIRPLTIRQRKQIITNHLGKHAKRLNADQLDRVAHGVLTKNPKLLKILLDELVIYGSYEGLDNFIDYYLSATNQQTFYNYLYDRYEADYGKELVTRVISILCLLEEDCISEDELVEITGTNLYNWSAFFCGARQQFEIIDGLIRMASHSHVDFRYISDLEAENQYRKQIIGYFKSKDYQHVDRYCKILAKQMREVEDKENFYQFLSQLPVYRMLYKVKDKTELRSYWYYVCWDDEHCAIASHSFHPLFQQMLDDNSPADEFHDLALLIRSSDCWDEETIINCLYEAEKRYEGLDSKKNLRYKALRDIACYVSDDYKAVEALEKALGDMEEYPGHDYKRIDCLFEMAVHYERLSSFSQAIECMENALTLYTEDNESQVEFNHGKYSLLIKLSEYYFAMEQYDHSLNYCKLAVALILLIISDKDYLTSDLIDLYIRMGVICLYLNMDSDSRLNVRNALELIHSRTDYNYSAQIKMCSDILEKLELEK